MENGKEPAFAMLDPNSSYAQYGLTKREYFAGLAMQSLVSLNPNWRTEDIARLSIKISDALLQELEKSQEK